MTEYHEAFWLTIGTAAPVIALAAVLTYQDAVRAAVKRRSLKLHLWTAVGGGTIGITALPFWHALTALREQRDSTSMMSAQVELLVSLVVIAVAAAVKGGGAFDVGE